jgi:hypothetical protein
MDQPIGYFSRSLNKAERRYSTTEKEALGIVAAIKHFRPFIYGSKFTVVTDHKPLKWLESMQNPPNRVARWIMELQQYNYKIEYKPGKTHKNADAVSRRPNIDENCNSICIEELPLYEIIDICGNKIEELKKEQEADVQLAAIIQALNEGETAQSLQLLDNIEPQYKKISSALLLKDGVLCKIRNRNDNKIVIIVPVTLRTSIMEQLHSAPLSGHLAFARTFNKMYDRFFWPGMKEDVENFCRLCDYCGSRKNPHTYGKAPLVQFDVSYPMEMMAMDVLGPLPVTDRGMKYILVVMDYFSKWPEVFALEDQQADTIVKCLLEVISRHGAMKILLSDQGSNFTKS